MANDFITSFAADENRANAARFHQDLVQAVERRRGLGIAAAMCRGGQGEANRPLVAEAQVFVALCSPAFYRDRGCGADWAVFEHRLRLVPAQWRPKVPRARVLVRWQPTDPPSGLPRAPIMSGEVTDSYACIGVQGIIREEGFRSEAYRHAVDEIAAAICTGCATSPPRVPTGELPDLELPFPRSAPCCESGPRAKVPHARRPQEDPKRPRVFLSYAHEPDGGIHKGRVEALHDRLHREGIDAHMDVAAHRKGPQHWGRWMREQYNAADFVLAIASPAYKRRAEHEEVQGQGDGVAYEADFILEERITDREWYQRILVVTFPEHGKAHVPDFLRGVTMYTFDPETGEGDLPDLLDYIKSKAS